MSLFFEQLFFYNKDLPLLFNSSHFFVLFFFFYLIYLLIFDQSKARVIYVVLFSTFFYYKTSGSFVLVLLLLTLSDYYLSKLMSQSNNKRKKKLYFIISISNSLFVLFYFKYTNFFLEFFHDFTSNNNTWEQLDIFLPVGISFYTFQSISYLIDLYNEKIKPSDDLISYAFYMTFFPQLVAGPIVRASAFLPQIKKPFVLDNQQANKAVFYILKGLIKKAIIADYLSIYVDLIFSNPINYSGFDNLIATYCYCVQIYCDFSGYSDMAIGIGLLLGYDLGINFNRPYGAKNITDFWRRWHISLSSWLKDYLYIPMGGNRKGKIRTSLYLFLTMLIGGFWHGASWNFVLWGALHGVALVIHKLLPIQCFRVKLFHLASWLLTFNLVAIAFVFFRSSDINNSFIYINHLFLDLNLMDFINIILYRFWFVFLTLSIIIYQVLPENWLYKPIYIYFENKGMLIKCLIFIFSLFLILQISNVEVQPFIYFQF